MSLQIHVDRSSFCPSKGIGCRRNEIVLANEKLLLSVLVFKEMPQFEEILRTYIETAISLKALHVVSVQTFIELR